MAERFRRTRPEKVQPLPDTLTALLVLRQTGEGTHAGLERLAAGRQGQD
ncbi:hypothetical protein [Nibrella viscosa]